MLRDVSQLAHCARGSCGASRRQAGYKMEAVVGIVDFLTVQVLDTTTGRPAAGLALVLTRVGDGELLAECATNADGRADGPLLAAAAMAPGAYELSFDVAAWRAGRAEPAGEAGPGFYDVVTIRFVLAAGPGHVHLVLLLSPYGYTTYRGS
jgi:5-hydroxyisourate hydrolase